MFTGSWKTSLAGLVAIVTALMGLFTQYNLTGTLPGESVTAAITAITAGIGLLLARDNKVTSEQAGAGEPPARGKVTEQP